MIGCTDKLVNATEGPGFSASRGGRSEPGREMANCATFGWTYSPIRVGRNRKESFAKEKERTGR